MEVDLEKSLNTAGKLGYLKEKMLQGVRVATYRSHDNILVLLVSFDPSIGYTENGKVIINMGGWGRIREIVKAQTGIDLLRHNLNELKGRDRVDNTAITTNDKLLSKAPTKGFLECRLLGSEKHIINVSNNYTHKQTQENAYLGVEINDLTDWNIDNIIIIENFNAFCRFNEQHAKLVKGLTGAVTVLAYRGHNNKNITSILKALAQKDCKRYIFADYDLAGLKIAESMSKTLKAHGYILPNKPWMQNEKYIEMTVKENRKKQSSIKISSPSLTSYFEHIRDKYLAVPQETLIARRILLTIVNA